MHIVELRLQRLFSYANTTISFPSRGVVLVTGKNGSGKSAAAVEALPWILWGETVRGSDPVPDGDAAVILSDGYGEEATAYDVRRSRAGRRLIDLHLGTSVADDDGATQSWVTLNGQTPTETQGKIVERLGDFRRFAATRVFSRALLSKFSGATDKERKALLERVLGLEQFDRAHKIAREKLRDAKQREAEAESSLRARQAAAESSSHALRAERDARGADGPTVEQLRDQLAACQAEIATLGTKRDLRELTAMVRAAESAKAKAKAECQAADGSVRRLTSEAERFKKASNQGNCPTCGQTFKGSAQLLTATLAELEAAKQERHRLGDVSEAAEAEWKELADDLAIIAGREQDREREVKKFETRLGDLRRDLALQQSWQETEARLTSAVHDNQRAATAAAADLKNRHEAVLEADFAAEALGPRGARVSMFGGALSRLEAASCEVLARLAPGAVLRLDGQTKLANGEIADKVSLRLEGPWGAKTYQDASDGQRVRVDVALLLGLARIAGDDGLLVLDEVFDPLDDEGMEAVAELVTELGMTRQVLVTTHSPRFADLLPTATRLSVELDDNGHSVVREG